MLKRSSQISLPGSRQVPPGQTLGSRHGTGLQHNDDLSGSVFEPCFSLQPQQEVGHTVTGLQRNDDSSGNVAVVAVAATFRGPGPSRTFQGPLGIPRELQGTLKGLSRDLQGRTRDPQGASRDPQGSPRTLQGGSRDGPGTFRNVLSDVLRPGTLQGPSGDFPGTLKDP